MTGRLSFALIGEHIAYSRSPAVFEAIFRADGVEGSFRVHEVSAAAFAEEFPRLLRSGVHGLAVTIPHKERVAPFLDDLDPVARALGAVNSIAIADRLRGFNTDVAGFRFALENYRAVVAGRPALVLGCGGAARAAVYALHRHFGVPSIVITSRRAETLERTVERLRKGMAGLEITPAPAARLLPLDRPVGVVVNATPLGGGNHPRELPLPKAFDWTRAAVYYDLNYNDDNQAVGCAREAGVAALDGAAMLVAQAIESYRRWTGRTVPFDPVFAAAFPRRTR